MGRRLIRLGTKALPFLAVAFAVVCPAAARDDLQTYNVPAGDAEDSIPLFSQQAGRSILAPGEALTGVKTNPIRGNLTFEAALAILLKDTPLQVASDDGRTVVLVRRAGSKTASEVSEFPQESVPESIIVTGYRASLADSTQSKRAAIGFTDSVFSEEIGKFSDTNIAEAVNRIPGITISREINGEGVNVQIRGLGTNFTKVLLNGNPIAIASTGVTDATNTNREVDLNIFPMELFTELTVAKTLSADQIEGGAAGIVMLRSMRPFDRPGFQVSYNVQLTDETTTNLAIGKRGTLIVSDTSGPFGVLVGFAGVQNNIMVTGWEDGNAGWVSPNLPQGACGTGNTCGQFGGSAWTIPATVPNGVFVPVPSGFSLAGGYSPTVVNGMSYFPAGYPVNSAMLYALNVGLADPSCTAATPTAVCVNQVMTRLSNTLLPRLGRPMFEKGSRDRYDAILSLEYRPSDDTSFYFDGFFGKSENHLNRSDIGWGVRTGNSATQMIPAGLTISPDWLGASFTSGLGGAAQSGRFYNTTMGLEARDYRETGDFLSLNPGVAWRPSDMLQIALQANFSSSHFFRRNPTVMVSSCTSTQPLAGIDNCPNGPPQLGTVLTLDNTGPYPVQSLNLDLNDPRNFEWNLGRVNLNGEKRWTTIEGTHLDVTYGGGKFAVKAGAAYDVTHRLIRSYDASGDWRGAICGNGPSAFVLGPNSSMPDCTGQNTTGTPAGWTYPYAGWGTGYTAGLPPLSFSGSLVPTSDLAKYLKPGPIGFVTVDYEKIFAASNYWNISRNAVDALSCVPHCAGANAIRYPLSLTSIIDERTTGLYGKVLGALDIGDRRLKYDVGLRWVETRQYLVSPVTMTDQRNTSLLDGGKYPNYQSLSAAKTRYQAWLPAASLVYEITDNFQVRMAVSRSMTRPNPGDMRAAIDFGDPTVTTAVLGNPNLKPFFSNNFDIGAEFYTGGEGYIGFAAFRKSISGFTAQLNTPQAFSFLAQYGITYNTLTATQRTAYANGGPSGIPCDSDATCANQPIIVVQQQNVKGLEIINGLELDIVQPLDFLTERYLGVTGFGIAGNVTTIDQKSTGSIPTYAIGVSPLQYNVTGYFETSDVMLRLSYNWNDVSYNSGTNVQNVCFPAAASGMRPVGCPQGAYVFTSAYGQADLSSSLRLAALFGDLPGDPQLTMDVQNLLNAKQRSYDMLPDAIHNYYIKGQTLLLGLRGTF